LFVQGLADYQRLGERIELPPMFGEEACRFHVAFVNDIEHLGVK
jgi:hypothetical protein